jgi:hypothetical protein
VCSSDLLILLAKEEPLLEKGFTLIHEVAHVFLGHARENSSLSPKTKEWEADLTGLVFLYRQGVNGVGDESYFRHIVGVGATEQGHGRPGPDFLQRAARAVGLLGEVFGVQDERESQTAESGSGMSAKETGERVLRARDVAEGLARFNRWYGSHRTMGFLFCGGGLVCAVASVAQGCEAWCLLASGIVFVSGIYVLSQKD